MASNKKTSGYPHTKKELKKELAGKMESALPEIKATLGEKKFQRRIKKAAKMLVQGLHNKDLSENNGTANKTVKKRSKKIKSLKKVKPIAHEAVTGNN